MNSRLDALYKQTIIEHNKNPRHFKEISPCSHQAHGKNPLCGDDYTVFIDVKDNVIQDIGFKGEGCAISKSSGSIMTSTLIGKPVEEALSIKAKFLGMILSEKEHEPLGKLDVFKGVKQYPIRVKCATLIWRALESALQEGKAISTET